MKNHDSETTTADLVDVDTTLPLLRSPDTLKDGHFPDCTCFAGPVYDFQIREFANGKPLHVYRFCRCCGNRAPSPLPRTTVSRRQWQELLIESGREV